MSTETESRLQQLRNYGNELKQKRVPQKHVVFVAGLVSGVSTAALFNPYDRALYLSVKDQRPFLHPKNWKMPFAGLAQSLLGRTISGGMYFPLYDVFKDLYHTELDLQYDSLWLSFLAGNSAGAVNGVVLNSLTAIKYRSWETGGSMFATARYMLRKGGLRPFFKGINSTVTRDTVFGGSFAFLTHVFVKALQQKASKYDNNIPVKFIGTTLAGAVATVLSSPFNYVRTIQYATSPGKRPPSALCVLNSLYKEARINETPLSFVQQRLRVGWGTFRVAIGMALGWQIYDSSKAWFDDSLGSGADSESRTT